MKKNTMWKNSKNRISVIVFCIGILLLGIGVGVSFVEFSNFKFGGKLRVHANNIEEQEITLKWDEVANGKDKKFHLLNWSDSKVEIIEDKDLADDKVVFQIKYPKDVFQSSVQEMPREDMDEELLALESKVWIYQNRRVGMSDMERFMRVKDAVLKGLKEKVYYDYDEDEEIECRLYVSAKHINEIVVQGNKFYE